MTLWCSAAIWICHLRQCRLFLKSSLTRSVRNAVCARLKLVMMGHCTFFVKFMTTDNNYNPLRENRPRNKFNNARTTRVFTENCNEVYEEQKDTAQKRIDAMIEETRKGLE